MKHVLLLAVAALGYAWVYASIGLGSGCARTTGPTPTAAPSPALYPPCPQMGQLPTTADICSGKETPDSRFCAACRDWSGCLDLVDGVYCALLGNCDADPLCLEPSAAPRALPRAR